MNYKALLKTIVILPLLLAGAYVIVILSYIIIPLLLVGIIGVVAYAIMQVIEEDKSNE